MLTIDKLSADDLDARISYLRQNADDFRLCLELTENAETLQAFRLQLELCQNEIAELSAIADRLRLADDWRWSPVS